MFPTTLIRIHAARCAAALDDAELTEELLDRARASAQHMGAKVAIEMIESVEDIAAAG